MRFDTIIMGGGLTGLTCGIRLAREGKRVAIVSAGQSTLHFHSGSMELLGNVGGEVVTDPIEAIARLDADHPYSKLGADAVNQLSVQAQALLSDTGIKTQGNSSANHYRLTPMGVLKPAWLTLEGFVTSADPDRLPWPKVTVIDLKGFIDFPLDFMVRGLQRMGVEVDVQQVTVPALREARRSSSEVRATSVARVLAVRSVLAQLATEIGRVAKPGTPVLMPAVLGLDDDEPRTMLQAQLGTALHLMATMPPSVPGVRLTNVLRHYYQMLGGTFIMGDTVCRGTIADGRIDQVNTVKLQDMPLRADNYVLATGSFMSRGLQANFERISEPVFDLDVAVPEGGREAWSRYGMMNEQPYMRCGVVTDEKLHPLKDGKPIANLYAAGSVLAGHNPVTGGDGTGVDMITALYVAGDILGK